MPTNYTKHQLRLFYFRNRYDQRVQRAEIVNVSAVTSTTTENETTEVTATVTATSTTSDAPVSTTTQSTAYAKETDSLANNVEPEVALSSNIAAAEPDDTTSSSFISKGINIDAQNTLSPDKTTSLTLISKSIDIDATTTSSTDTTCAVESNLRHEDGNSLFLQPTEKTSTSTTSDSCNTPLPLKRTKTNTIMSECPKSPNTVRIEKDILKLQSLLSNASSAKECKQYVNDVLSSKEDVKKQTARRKIVFNDVSGKLSHGEKLCRKPQVEELLKYFCEDSDCDELKTEVLSLFLQAKSLQPYLFQLGMSVAQMQVSNV